MNDDDLKQRFRELRARDRKDAPSFEKLTAERPRRVSPLIVLAPMFAAAAALLLWCGVASNSNKAAPPVAVVAPPLRARAPAALPLDFLLESTPISVHFDADPTEGLRP